MRQRDKYLGMYVSSIANLILDLEIHSGDDLLGELDSLERRVSCTGRLFDNFLVALELRNLSILFLLLRVY